MVFMTKTIVSALFGSALAQRPTKREPQQVVQESGIDIRRYKDLKLLALHYMPDFDERKYWAYGCNCLILGDRPMSDPGYGRPVDKLDNVCKAYKDCQKCVQMKFGPQCVGELVRYKWKKTRKNEIQCTDEPNTCERALCECDNKYTSEIPAARDVFDDKYHMFWGNWDYTDADNCVRTPGISEPECCGADDGPMVLFNSLNKECCLDKTVKPIGMCETF